MVDLTFGNSSLPPTTLNGNQSGTCENWYAMPSPWDTTIEIPHPFHLSIPLMNSSLIQSAIMFLMLIRQIWMTSQARAGSRKAAETLILGVYRNIFLYVFAITVFAAVTVAPNNSSDHDSDSNQLASLNWALHHFGYEGITVLLLHTGVGKRALKTSLIIATSWGIITYFCVLTVQNAGYQMDVIMYLCDKHKDVDFWDMFIPAVYSGALMVFYGLLLFLPFDWFHRRPALRNWCLYWFLYESVTMFDVLVTGNTDADYPFCFEQVNKMFLFGTIFPFILLRTLRYDSLFWQGLYSPQENSLNAPLMTGFGILRRDSVETIAGNLADDNQGVNQIPYGCVSFSTPQDISGSLIAAGASSKVYKGFFKRGRKAKKEVVAIKMLFCVELSASVIDRFGDEIRLLNRLSHPNILRCCGVCIMPPALCLVTEFCGHGSLYHFLQKEISISLRWNKKLSMILDCINGVSYLHSKGIVHGDIKSLNFFVTDNCVVKLGDLGEHRVVGEEVDVNRPMPKLRNWSAPEILAGTYGPLYDCSSDVYSLAMVISEIVSGEVPFDDAETKNLELDEFIHFVSDERNRPSLGGRCETPTAFKEVLRHCFFTDPKKRCSSTDLLNGVIECFETSEKVVSFVDDELDRGVILGSEEEIGDLLEETQEETGEEAV